MTGEDTQECGIAVIRPLQVSDVEKGVEVIANILEIPTALIQLFDGQPRDEIDWEYVRADFAPNIKRNGQREPGKVCLTGDPEHPYELVDGENRFHSCRVNGMLFRAMVIEVANKEEQYRASLASNFGGQPHKPLNIARNIQRLRDMGDTWEQVCDTLQKLLPWVTERYKLLQPHPDVQAMLETSVPKKDRLRTSVAADISKLPKDIQKGVAQRVRKMPVGRARQVVQKEQVEYGVSGFAGRDRRPSDGRQQFSKYISRVVDSLDLACTVDREQLEIMFPQSALFQHGQVVDQLFAIRTMAQGLIQTLYGILPENYGGSQADQARQKVFDGMTDLTCSAEGATVLFKLIFDGKSPDYHDEVLKPLIALLDTLAGFKKSIERSRDNHRM